MPVKHQPKNFIFIIGLAIAFIMLTAVSILTVLQINATKSETAAEERALQENNDKLQQLAQLTKRKSEFEASLRLMSKLIPNRADESEIITLIQNMSIGSSVEFVKIQFGDSVVNNEMNTMSMTMSFSGNFEGLVKLVRNIETGERLIRIDKVRMYLNENKKSVNADINVRTFYR